MFFLESGCMATAERVRPNDQRIVINGVSWKTFQGLLADRGERLVPRMAYDQGELELMSPSEEHEQYKKLIGYMIVFWAVEQGIPLRSLGSATFTLNEQQRSLEPDECYYIANESLVRGKREIELGSDPPPDLALEVDIASKSAKKLGLYAAIGIAEVWRYSRQGLQVYQLSTEGRYSLRSESACLVDFPVRDVHNWLARADSMDETNWIRSFQTWIRGPR